MLSFFVNESNIQFSRFAFIISKNVNNALAYSLKITLSESKIILTN